MEGDIRSGPNLLQFLLGVKPLTVIHVGDMTYIQTLAGNRIYVNSWEVASDLLEKRSANYSDRHKQPMLNEM